MLGSDVRGVLANSSFPTLSFNIALLNFQCLIQSKTRCSRRYVGFRTFALASTVLVLAVALPKLTRWYQHAFSGTWSRNTTIHYQTV